jgi:hypothetical protein
LLQVDDLFGAFDHQFKAHKLPYNLLDHFMVIPLFGALEVAHLIHQGLEPVVHRLWLLSLVEDKTTELPLDRLPFGDLGHLISLVRGLEHVPNLLGDLQPLHFIILLST